MQAAQGNDGKEISSNLRKGLVYTVDSKEEEDERHFCFILPKISA
jgi:hypothetical protein